MGVLIVLGIVAIDDTEIFIPKMINDSFDINDLKPIFDVGDFDRVKNEFEKLR